LVCPDYGWGSTLPNSNSATGPIIGAGQWVW
jgi:hypothetical protein